MQKIFFILCVVGSLFLVIRPDIGARWTYKIYKNYWGISEEAIPFLRIICRYWNIVMCFIFIYLIFKY